MLQSSKKASEAQSELKSESFIEQDEEAQPAADRKDETHQYPELRVVVPVIIALLLSIFLVAIDRTIIGTAIPAISDDFDSFGDISWYGSAYLATLCAFQLLSGRIYTYYAPKWIFLSSIIIFEIGSILCAAAPTSHAFIAGRAIAGVGSAGIFSGAVVLMIATVPLRKRPSVQAFFGVVMGISGVLGPLVGGAFTTKVSWRWCFWINVPIGGLTMVVIFLILPQQPAPGGHTLTWKQKLLKLDPIGTLVLLPAIVCIILALQWGGFTYRWSDKRIIILLTFGCLLLCSFLGVQLWKKDDATVPPRILRNRSIFAGFIGQTSIGSAMMILVYYLPIWFQAIKDFSAVKSGVAILPYILGLVVFSVLAGITVSRIGYYTPPMIIGTALMVVGAGLLTTFRITTELSHWVGYQVVFGTGLGLAMQQSNIAAQTVLARKDVPVGISLMWFGQSFGGALCLSLSQNVLQNDLVHTLRGIADFDPTTIAQSGATNLRQMIPVDDFDIVLGSYNHALVHVFYIALGLSCVGFLCSLAMEWKSVKAPEKE